MQTLKFCDISYIPENNLGRKPTGGYLTESGKVWFERLVAIAGSRKAMGEKIGYSAPFIGDILIQKKPLSNDVLTNIEKWTKGYITRDYLIGNIPVENNFKLYVLLKQIININVPVGFFNDLNELLEINVKVLEDLRIGREFQTLNCYSVLEALFGTGGDSPAPQEKAANDIKKTKKKRKVVVKKKIKNNLRNKNHGDIVSAA